MVGLLDSNVLIAFLFADHTHHGAALRWWGAGRRVATCPITRGALVRYSIRAGYSPDQALTLMQGLSQDPNHQFWSDDIDFDAGVLAGVRGHRQVTDAYLVALAKAKGGVLVTFDRGIAELRPTAVELIA